MLLLIGDDILGMEAIQGPPVCVFLCVWLVFCVQLVLHQLWSSCLSYPVSFTSGWGCHALLQTKIGNMQWPVLLTNLITCHLTSYSSRPQWILAGAWAISHLIGFMQQPGHFALNPNLTPNPKTFNLNPHLMVLSGVCLVSAWCLPSLMFVKPDAVQEQAGLGLDTLTHRMSALRRRTTLPSKRGRSVRRRTSGCRRRWPVRPSSRRMQRWVCIGRAGIALATRAVWDASFLTLLACAWEAPGWACAMLRRGHRPASA